MQNKFYLTEKLPPYIFAAMYKLKTEAAAKGLEIIDFGMGNPDCSPPKHVMEKLAELTPGGSFAKSVLEVQVEHARAEAEHARAEAEQAKILLSNITNSRLWRMTLSIRKVSDMLKRKSLK